MTPPDSPLRVVESGRREAPLVVLLHGWGSSATVMQGFANALADRYCILNVDLPGHGTAPPPAAPMGMEEHAGAVASLLDRPAHVIGHSNGGRIALFMASHPRHSPLVRSLSLVSPSGIERPRSTGFQVRRALATTLKAPFGLLPPPLREAGLDWLRHSLVWRLLGSSDYRALDGTMRETFVRLVNTYVADRLDRIAVPTLLFWGTSDEAVLRPQIDALVHGIANAGLVTLEGAGHYGFLDQPDRVFAGTRHFLDTLEGAE